MGIKLKQLEMFLDRPPIFRPGEAVTGHCLIELDGQMSLNQLSIKLEGTAYCRLPTDENDFHFTQMCLDLKYDPGMAYPIELNGGQHSIEFNFLLPPKLPSSFEGKYGHIRYKLKAIIQTPIFTFDKHNEIEITIQTPAFVSIQELTKEVKRTTKVNVAFFSSKFVIVSTQLQRCGHNIGTSIPIICLIENNSKKKLDLRASLNQLVTYRASYQKRHKKSKVCAAQGTSIEPKSNHTEVLSLVVPPTAPVTSNFYPMITIEYEIEVSLVKANSLFLSCSLPIVLTNENLPELI